MFLQVTFTDGTTLDIGLSNSHTVQVVSPQNAIENAFAVSGVVSVELVEGEPPVPEPSASQPVETAAADAAVAAPDAGAVTADTAADETATTDTVVEDTAVDPPVAAPSSDASSEPQTTSSTTTTDPADSEHDEAVQQAQEAVQIVADAPKAEKGELLAVVSADIESALATWPDSPALLDAKEKLTELAAEAA